MARRAARPGDLCDPSTSAAVHAEGAGLAGCADRGDRRLSCPGRRRAADRRHSRGAAGIGGSGPDIQPGPARRVGGGSARAARSNRHAAERAARRQPHQTLTTTATGSSLARGSATSAPLWSEAYRAPGANIRTIVKFLMACRRRAAEAPRIGACPGPGGGCGQCPKSPERVS